MIQADVLGAGNLDGVELDLEKELEKEMASQAWALLMEVLLVFVLHACCRRRMVMTIMPVKS